MTRRSTYEVAVHRSGRWWALSVPDVRGALSQCRRLDQAEAMIREAIGAVLDVREDSFDVTLEIELPAEVGELVNNVAQARTHQDDAARSAREVMQSAARELVDRHGLSTRDAGRVLGVSHQRISQVLRDSDAVEA